MAHLYRTEEYEDPLHRWVVGDCNECGRKDKPTGWYVAVRLLDISPSDYINLLVNDFNAFGFKLYNDDKFLNFYFHTQAEARKYKNWINKKARDKNFII